MSASLDVAFTEEQIEAVALQVRRLLPRIHYEVDQAEFAEDVAHNWAEVNGIPPSDRMRFAEAVIDELGLSGARPAI